MQVVRRYDQIGGDEPEVGKRLETFLERWRSVSRIRFEPVRVEHKLKRRLLGLLSGWSEIGTTVSHGNPCILSSIANGLEKWVKPSLIVVHPNTFEQAELTMAAANEASDFPRLCISSRPE